APDRRHRAGQPVITFVLIAAAMVAAALAWILVPLLRSGGGGTSVAREASNVAILRDQLRELEADLGHGTLSREQYDQARAEPARRVLDESKAVQIPARATPSTAAAWPAAIVAGALPIAALVIYVALGNFDAFSPIAARGAGESAAGQHDISPEQIDKMIAE